MDKRLKQQIDFILEADKLKSVLRRNYLVDDSRCENTAEHSWHTILMALILFEYAENKSELDLLRIVKMISIHDLVEIEAGDTFMFDREANKFNKEKQAAKNIFEMLPYDQGKEYFDLWLEFENGDTPDAVYAAAVDKIMPVLLNTSSSGKSWREANITSDIIIDTLVEVKRGPKAIKSLLAELVETAKDKGILEK